MSNASAPAKRLMAVLEEAGFDESQVFNSLRPIHDSLARIVDLEVLIAYHTLDNLREQFVEHNPGHTNSITYEDLAGIDPDNGTLQLVAALRRTQERQLAILRSFLPLCTTKTPADFERLLMSIQPRSPLPDAIREMLPQGPSELPTP